MTNITVIGAGMMGTALCWPLSDNGHQVTLVGTPLDEEIIRSIRKDGFHPTLQRKIPSGITACYCEDLEAAIEGADLIVNGVSSFGIDWFAGAVGPYLTPGVPVLAVTKGLAVQPDGDLLPLTEYVNERLDPALQGRVSLNAIGGPCIAHELAARRQTCVVFAGSRAGDLQRLKALCQTPYYHIWTTTDIKEVSICSAMKNGYALAVGIAAGMLEREGADGLAQMYNTQAAIFAQSTMEIRWLIQALGGKEEAVSWLPGAGDLYVTVFGGRTRRLGVLIGQGHCASEALEIMAGVTLESVEIIARAAQAVERLGSRGVSPGQFPLLRFLNGVVHQDQPVRFPWDAFFSPE